MTRQQHQSVAEPDRPWEAPPDLRALPALGEPLSVRTRDEPKRTWVTPVGELDLATRAAFDEHLRHAQSRSGWVVLDLRALSFIDCGGLRPLLAAWLRAAEHDHHLEVLCGPGQVARVLSISGADQVLNVIGPPAPVRTTARSAMTVAALSQ